MQFLELTVECRSTGVRKYIQCETDPVPEGTILEGTIFPKKIKGKVIGIKEQWLGTYRQITEPEIYEITHCPDLRVHESTHLLQLSLDSDGRFTAE